MNLSPQSLVNEDLPRLVAANLERAGVAAELLTIEITEQSVIGDVPRTLRILEQLDRLGVKISIDDFGTGYSSLAYLKRFDIDYLKLDKSFVSNLESDATDLALSETIVVMAHKLGICVVAEGVERRKEMSKK